VRIGFLINPIAGMGGRVGLKGTDGVLEEAIRRGAEPVSERRASEFTASLRDVDVEFLTCSAPMGENVLGGMKYTVVYRPGSTTTSEDTRNACKTFLEHRAELIVFVGGDGTARDVASAVGHEVPILGVPSGVKMHSGVFALNPERAAEVVREFAEGVLSVGTAEVMDLDEGLYRTGVWKVRMYHTALTPSAPAYVQSGKFMVQVDETEVRRGIGYYLEELMLENPGTLFIVCGGSTLRDAMAAVGLEKTLLGVDLYARARVLELDVYEKQILEYLDRYEDARIVVSPIGSQGFIFGRGNLQVTPEIIRRVGIDGIIVVCTPAKLLETPVLRVDTGDPELDREFQKRGELMVVVEERTKRLMPVEI